MSGSEWLKKLPKQLKHSPNPDLGFCVIGQLPLVL